MNFFIKQHVSIIVFLIILSACNGGNGGTNPSPNPTVPVPTNDGSQKVIIANSGSNTLAICNAQNQQVTQCVTSNENTVFNKPWGVAFDGFENLFVSNAGNNTVAACSFNGGQISNCNVVNGDNSNSNNTFSNPTGIDFDVSNNMYVANLMANTISICPVNNNGVIGSCVTSDGNGTFNLPWGVAYYSGYLFVANSGANTLSVCKINTNGSLGLQNCTTSNGPPPSPGIAGLFNFPAGIVIDKNGNLFVANGNNSSVVSCVILGSGQISDCVNSYGTAFTFSANQSANDIGGGLALDEHANLYVTNSTNALTICTFNSSLAPVCINSGIFNAPLGIALK